MLNATNDNLIVIMRLLTYRNDDGGSTLLWNVGVLPRDYMALYPRVESYWQDLKNYAMSISPN
jgi:hypothetical protein